jgi:hypothetical protein
MKVNLVRYATSVALLLSALIAGAQNTEIFGVFPTIDHSGRLSERWECSLYYFGAFNVINPEAGAVKDTPHPAAFYSEQAIHYNATKKLSFSASYVYERQNALRANYRNENRFYLQGTCEYALDRTTIKHRWRYDGRYIEDRQSGKAPYTNRLRYLAGFNTPLKKESDQLYFAAYNEFFFNLDKSATAIYGENWAFAGVGFKTKGKTTFEMGPLYIFWVSNKNNDLINFYYLQLSWITHLDFRKTKND